MTTWILVYMVYANGIGTSAANDFISVATGTAVFHSQASCIQALTHFKKGFCLEDKADDAGQPIKK